MDKTYRWKDIKKYYPELCQRTVMSWMERGLIKPYKDATGRGTKRIYSLGNMVEIGIMRALLNIGLPFRMIMQVANSSAYRATIESNQYRNESWLIRFEVGVVDIRIEVNRVYKHLVDGA
jgi:DNA-binding transcriptional MerR regulator